MGLELSQSAFGTPIDEHVAAWEDLSATLRLGKQVVRREVSSHELGCPRLGVQSQDFTTAGRSRMDFGAVIVLGAMCAVVVQTDDLHSVFLGQPAGVVLEAKLGTVGHLEIGSLAVETLLRGRKRISRSSIYWLEIASALTQIISPSVPLTLWTAHASRAEIR